MATLEGSYNGLSFGAGTDYHVSGVEGLWDLPELRTTDLPKSGGTGYFVGRDRAASRTVILTLTLVAATAAAYDTLVTNLRTATDPQTTDKPLRLMGNTVYVNARPRRRIIPIATDRQQRIGVTTIEFFCADPTVYTGAPPP